MNSDPKPVVSVIVPVFMAEKHLQKCIESILNQTFENFELVLVDDGSLDSSGKICDYYSTIDQRVISIHQENHGASAARNNGIRQSKGDYILFVDSDDYLECNYIKKLYECRTDFTVCGVKKEDETGRVFSTIKYDLRSKESDAIDFAFLYNCSGIYSPYCKLFVASIIHTHHIEFPLGIQWGEDGMFVADYLAYIKDYCYLDYVGYHYVRYKAQNTLSSTIRADIIDDIVYTREYCIKRIKGIASDYLEVKEKITNNIILNCSDFVKRVLDSSLRKKEKKIMLEVFLKNNYVQKSIFERSDNYSKNQLRALRCKSTGRTIFVYYFLKKKEKTTDIFKKLKRRIYRLFKRR